ncbi:hypothetical protein LAZ67_1005773 [Cordylochernes scorpioides]|uniref:G-protein coupled receptors family 1 profile domain-containing protein n=1 Tax=Cordylochernes scorpioides TaxID=51811 RepID=A0ABY6JYQ2_9ARAC|nr:hypothetical protein LAZ67_1005773 [Cordylochernes scorpioides]
MNPNATFAYHYHGKGAVISLEIALGFIMITAIGGNLLVLVTIAKHRALHTQTNAFIASLATADVLVALVNIPLSAVTLAKGTWPYTMAICRFHAFTMALFLIASIHTLMHIAIHKYLSITRRFNRRSRPLRVKLMLIGAWLWAGLCAAFPLMGWSQTVYKAGASQCGPALPSKLPDYLHSLLINSTNYVLPLVVMTFCYFRIFREIHLHMQKRQSRAVEQQKRIAVTLLLVVICFVVCWTPYIVYSVTAGAMKNKEALPLIFNPIVSIGAWSISGPAPLTITHYIL